MNDLGVRAEGRGMRDEAIALYQQAIALAPAWEAPWFNLGLVYKRQRDWRESMRCNHEAATRLEDRDGQPALWNLGIAATALGEWRVAREAWAAFGIDGVDESSDQPLELKLGSVPIRINPEGTAEVVWCQRIDPARGIIKNVPTPESGRRYGDLILHDGVPRGSRVIDGEEVPVFEELEVLRHSELSTFRAVVTAETPEDGEAIEELFADDESAAEDWTGNIRILCKACSEGSPGDHDHRPADGWSRERTFGVAAQSEELVRERLLSWSRSGAGRTIVSVERAL